MRRLWKSGTNLFSYCEKKGSVSFFGDEAVRQVGKHFVFTYSLVGGSPEPLSSIGESLVSLKHELEPNIDPKLWTFHLTKMWSGQKRLRHRVYRKWDRAKVEHAASSMAAILSAKKNALWLWNVTHVTTFGGTPANSQLRNWVRDQTFTTMLMDAINETTKLGARPDFTFDATAIKAGKPKKAGWPQECLLGLRDTLLYGFLVWGMAIEAPKIVLPGSTSGLEFADLISFTIGRYFHTRLLDRSVDIDPAVLGKIRYGAILNFSDYIYSESEGYPWDELFEGKL